MEGCVVGTVGDSRGHVHVRSSETSQEGIIGVSDTGLRDATVEVTLKKRGVYGVVDLGGAKRLTRDNHAVWVTTELGDVLLHPFEDFELVEDTIVTGGAMAGSLVALFIQLRMREVSECIVAAVEGDEDNVLEGHATTIPPGVVAALVRALVPHHDWESGIRRAGVGPEVQTQTVLADVGAVPTRTRRAKRGGFQCFVPWLAGLRWLPAILVASIGSEGNAQKRGHVGFGDVEEFLEGRLVEVLEALHGTVICLDNFVPQLGLGDCSAQDSRDKAFSHKGGHAGLKNE